MEKITALAPGYFVEAKGPEFSDVIYINPITGAVSEPNIKMAVYEEGFKNSFGQDVPFTRRVEAISYTDAKKALAHAKQLFPEVQSINLIGSEAVNGPRRMPALGYSTSNLYVCLGNAVAVACASLLLGNVLTRDAIIDMISRIQPGLWGEVIDAPRL